MRWAFWRKEDWEEAGERARRLHSLWLTDAIASGRPQSRIPVRRVDDGGFARVSESGISCQRADRWWSLALEKVDG